MSIKSLRAFMEMEEAAPVVSSDEATTIVNETTTRIDPEVPAVGAPVEPEAQEPSGPETPEPVEEEVEVVEVTEPAPEQVESVELPEEVTPADVAETEAQVEETISQVEENGVTPETMRLIHMAWGAHLQQFGIRLPRIDQIKSNSINLRASYSTVNALKSFKNYLKCFKTN